MLLRKLSTLLLACALLVCTPSCFLWKGMINAIPTTKDLKKLHVPTMHDVKQAVPGLGSDSVSADDPLLPFDPALALGYGHTLRLEVYDGSRALHLLWKGLVMVDQSGVIAIEDFGSAKVGGHSVTQAQTLIAKIFIQAGHTASQVHVHVNSIENTPIITVSGDVKSPVALPLWKGITVSDAIAHAGGRPARSTAHSLYVTHGAERKFFTSEAAANQQVTLRAGDIITLSPDL
jgi:protein involved in polysaccharide export with SLBB domain